MSDDTKTISILGVTGSIGSSTSKVILSAPEQFNVQNVTAHSNVDELAKKAIALRAKRAIISDEQYYNDLKTALSATNIEVAAGRDSLIEFSQEPVDVTMAAVVGIAGLEPVMAAMKGSSAIAVANKEPLVSAGELVLDTAKKSGVKILPVDSEHNAIFQVLDEKRRNLIKRIILTASGGPFREYTLEQMVDITPQQAVKHPNWSMGAKISVDSATMMNKALEIIEAYYLFDMPANQIDVIIHPQSIIHSMVEYIDGSVLSQMGASDMCTPIAYALGWPNRIKTPGDTLDFKTISKLEFYEPDFERFQSLKLAYACLEKGQWACAAFNAANEVAVAAFLDGRIGFLDILRINEDTLEQTEKTELNDLNSVIEFDKLARDRAERYIHSLI